MRKIIAVVTILAAFFSVYYMHTDFHHSGVYDDKASFRDFANKALNARVLFKENKDTKTEYKYEYDGQFSATVRTDEKSPKAIRSFRDETISDRIKDCQVNVAMEESEDTKHACVIDSSVRRSGNGADSLVVYTRLYGEKDDKMRLESEDVRTYLFDKGTTKEIEPEQAMNVTYRHKAAAFARDYFLKTYGEKKLNKDWETYISESEDNFNNFIMTGSSVIFFFDENTVLKKSEGIVSMNVPYQYMESAVRPEVVSRVIDPEKPMVALTYDDGPGGKSEERILKCLEDHNSVATFFYLGVRMEYFGDNAARAAQIGCEIGNHSWDHPTLTTESKKKVAKEIERTNKVISETTGVTPELIRPPYGDYNKKVNKIVKKEGMAAVLWTVDTLDWKTRNAKKIFKSVKKVKNLDGKIILMHSIYDETAKASEQIIPWLEEQGYQTVTVSELLYYKTGKIPQPGQTIIKIK